MTNPGAPKGRQPVVVGIHALPFAKDIGMTERHAGALAILGALAECGLSVDDVDGMCRYFWEKTTELEMARILGVRNMRYFGEVDYGGGAGAPVVSHACMALELGLADVVVTWRARNRSSGGRPWAGQLLAEGQDQFERPFGVVRPVDGFAFHVRIMMERWGWTREDLAHVAMTIRGHANRNPAAMMHGRELTLEQYMSSRWIAEPLCLFDNCLETDAALAMVLTTAERAADLDLPHAPAYVSGYAFGSGPEGYAMTFFYGDQLGVTPNAYVAPELWRNTGLRPSDVDVVQLYDAFTPQIPLGFQEFGFCADGEGAAFMRSADAPVFNTSGGGLSEAYTHGFNLLLEGVRQVRGTSTSQAGDVRHSLVTSGNVVPTGAIVFSKEPR